MNRRILTWGTRIALVCAISVAMIGPALAVHAAPHVVSTAVSKPVASAVVIGAVAPSVMEPLSGSTKVLSRNSG